MSERIIQHQPHPSPELVRLLDEARNAASQPSDTVTVPAAELAALRADAARYRWLREKAEVGTAHARNIYDLDPWVTLDFSGIGESLDAAIDAAREATP